MNGGDQAPIIVAGDFNEVSGHQCGGRLGVNGLVIFRQIIRAGISVEKQPGTGVTHTRRLIYGEDQIIRHITWLDLRNVREYVEACRERYGWQESCQTNERPD